MSGGFSYSNGSFIFSFLFYLAEYLKIHNKSQKNHKIKNQILLEVDIQSEHIIWYDLL